jgi:hypothetical protein
MIRKAQQSNGLLPKNMQDCTLADASMNEPARKEGGRDEDKQRHTAQVKELAHLLAERDRFGPVCRLGLADLEHPGSNPGATACEALCILESQLRAAGHDGRDQWPWLAAG